MALFRIGVLMGGMSLEREVSFNSGRTVCDHLDTSRYEVIPLFHAATGELYILPYRFLHRGKTTDFVHRLATQATQIIWDDLPNLVDGIYIALHGRHGEDGSVQGMLEILGIPYIGAKVRASAMGMDKVLQKTVLQLAHIRTPHSIVVYPPDTVDSALFTARNLGFPVIVKPHHEGSSYGVSIAHDEHELKASIMFARTINGAPQTVLIEELITGMEFSCLVIAGRAGNLHALPPTEIVPESELYTYEEKYMPGRAHKYTPARCSTEIIQKIQQTAIATMRALEFVTIGRIDGFVTPTGDVVIIDPNSMSGMAPSSYAFLQAAEVNMSHTDFINHLINSEFGTMADDCARNTGTLEKTERIRVAVLFGGNSHEREISLESGRNVCYKLSPQQYEAIPLFVTDKMYLYRLDQKQLVRNRTSEIAQDLDPASRVLWSDVPKIADFVFIALHGGSGENGTIQGALELLKIAYNGSGIATSALCMDKYKTNRFLAAHGFHVPQGILITKANLHELDELIPPTTTFPRIVKPHDDGCSVMVQKVDTHAELCAAVHHILASGKEGALVEELITGMELTVGVLGNDTPHALPASQAVTQNSILSIQEKFLPGAGENQTPAPLSPAAAQLVRETMEGVFRTVGGRGYARIDCFYQSATQSPTGTERVVIIEINTLPGLTPATCIFHQAAEIGMRPMEFIDQIIKLGFEAHPGVTRSGVAHPGVAHKDKVTSAPTAERATSVYPQSAAPAHEESV